MTSQAAPLDKRGSDPVSYVRNRLRVRAIKQRALSDLDALALLFEDDGIVDDGTVTGRVRAILRVTDRWTIRGLQTGIHFGDTGFRGDQKTGGRGFRDPWPSSRNQVGHFLTALGLKVAPEIVARPVPILGSVRAIVGAPAGMSDADVAVRMTIGHEKAADPPTGADAARAVLAAATRAYDASKKDGESALERDRRVARIIVAETRGQVAGILAEFRAQFSATTDGDVVAWHKALRMSARGRGTAFDTRAIEGWRSPLRRIKVSSGEGNSMQDLRLSLVGWRLGELIQSGALDSRGAVGAWLRATLGAAPSP